MTALKKYPLSMADPDLYAALVHEQQRQEQHIELIASENYVSPGVMALQGSILTNKYAEGYPGKRYYGGCEFVDIAEQLAIERAKALFQADYANVQPHSGSQANAAVLMALMNPGETLLGMRLAEGGHLTHGTTVNFSGKFYHAVQYGIDKVSGYIDYQQVAELARTHKPRVIMTGFSAYSRIVDWKIFREIADSVGAWLVADIAHVAGLVATGLYPSPIPYADVVTSTTHKTLRGPRGGLILARKNPEVEKRLQSAVFPGTQGGPLMHVIAAKALAFLEAQQPAFKEYQQQVLCNARVLAAALQEKGFPVISGGTDNHLLLVDLRPHQLTGKAAETALGQANITLNKNTIPDDPQSPFITSGLRLGTPAVTTRGFREQEMRQIAQWISGVLKEIDRPEKIASIKEEVLALCRQFPVYE